MGRRPKRWILPRCYRKASESQLPSYASGQVGDFSLIAATTEHAPADALDLGNGTVSGSPSAFESGFSNAAAQVDVTASSLLPLANLTGLSAGDLLRYDGSSRFEPLTCTTAGAALLDDADASAQRTTLGLGSGDGPTFTKLTLSGTGSSNGVSIGGDARLYRSNSGELGTDNNLRLATPNRGIHFPGNASSEWVIGNEMSLATSALVVKRTSGSGLIYISNGSNAGLTINPADGKLSFGTGSGTTVDTNLYRSTNETLKTDNNFIVGGTYLQLPVKGSTGDPASPSNGWMYVNTADNAVRVYADGAWRDLATW